MNEHEWIEVKDRRWCIGCDAFQRKGVDEVWSVLPEECPRNTPFARERDCRSLTRGGETLTSDELWKFCPPGARRGGLTSS